MKAARAIRVVWTLPSLLKQYAIDRTPVHAIPALTRKYPALAMMAAAARSTTFPEAQYATQLMRTQLLECARLANAAEAAVSALRQMFQMTPHALLPPPLLLQTSAIASTRISVSAQPENADEVSQHRVQS